MSPFHRSLVCISSRHELKGKAHLAILAMYGIPVIRCKSRLAKANYHPTIKFSSFEKVSMSYSHKNNLIMFVKGL